MQNDLIRIAIYSRKSKWTGKGESVENQITMCREYIEMFVEGGDQAEIIVYEDEGFSGKNTKRPQFQKMMHDMKALHFDYLVCYKLDRLGRNLADLANLMEDLEHRGTSFISIKEKFDTTTPIGKAMLYFSGVLAQMEREQIAERVKDNMIMLARSGRWLGGNTPLGYSSMKLEKEVSALKKKSMFCLTQNPEEIDIARYIFSNFIECRSLTKVFKNLLNNDIKTRQGKEFVISGIRDILVNPVYCKADREAYQYFYDLGCQVCIDEEELDGESGLMGYAKTTSTHYKNQNLPCESWIISKGRHKGIVSGKEFVRVQKLLESNKEKGATFKNTKNSIALLSGLLYCSCGHMMRPKNYPASRLTEKGERTFAYRCPYKDATHREKCDTQNVHGNTLDAKVCEEIIGLTNPDAGIVPMLETLLKKIKETDMDVVSEKGLLQQEYNKKKEEIQKLIVSIKNLDADSVSVQYINDEIKRTDGLCRQLQTRIAAMESDKEANLNVTDYVKGWLEKMKHFPQIFEALSVMQKRDFLRAIIEKVVWDGEIAHIYIKNPVTDRHRDIFAHLKEAVCSRWYPKFPIWNHRIAASAWSDDGQKFSFGHLQRYVGKCGRLSFEIVVCIGDILKR
ncbi:MAG: recombinase family protein [Lachnospiraceae bacterium]|nr:recombinase family protein [Lachnospiraceae bacterium]